MKRFQSLLGLFCVAVLFFGCNSSDNAAVSPSEAEQKGFLTDSRDGQTYKIVTIGTQTWMAQNLNYAIKGGSYCYENNATNCIVYGRLYTWEIAMKACPSGWHLPSEEEWKTLYESVGDNASKIETKLKSQTEWRSDMGNGTDDFGFCALPAGCTENGGKSFRDLGLEAYFWSSTEEDQNFAYSAEPGRLFRVYKRSRSYSVRCLKD